MDILHLLYTFIIIISSLGVILSKKPVHSCLFFLVTLIQLAAIYLQLYSPFISVMQVLIYAGAILVIFMFVIVLFQDAYLAISHYPAKSNHLWIILGACSITSALIFLAWLLPAPKPVAINEQFGSVTALGKALYLDFFFPFEAVGLLFLVAIVGALYIGKKVR